MYVNLSFRILRVFKVYYYYCQFMIFMLKIFQQEKIQLINIVLYYEFEDNNEDVYFNLLKIDINGVGSVVQ